MVALTSPFPLSSVTGVSAQLQASPLAEVHRAAGAQIVPFAGWEMPIRYGSILEEHRAVRESAGMFDISHMGQLFVRGGEAGAWLDTILTNDVGRLQAGSGHYTFLLNADGGVIDDLILYRIGKEEFLAVVNAAKKAEDVAWLRGHLRGGVELEDAGAAHAGIAVQGPAAPDVYRTVTDGTALPPHNGVRFLAGGRQIVCRTGYTGEDGFEFFCPADEAERWFRDMMGAGARPCGLGARDTLRLEMCYPLNGADLSPERSPLEAGLGIFVALEKGPFMGRDPLLLQKEEGVRERLAAIRCDEKGPPVRAGCPVFSPGGEQLLGTLTSGTMSPSLGLGIGMAYLPRDSARAGTPVEIEVRGRRLPASVVKKPFYKPR